jgi:hypothetical protein
MLCEMCHEREALVHLTMTTKADPMSDEATTTEKHHFCELCAEASPLANPVLRYGPDVINEQLKVISVSPEHTVVRLVRTETEPVPEEWSLLTSKLPPKFAVVGMQFGVLWSSAELRMMQGKGATKEINRCRTEKICRSPRPSTE